MVQDTYQYDFLVKAGIPSQCWRDKDAVLLVPDTFKGTTDKDTSEPAHVVVFFSQGKDFGLNFFPFPKCIYNQTFVHTGHHQTVAIPIGNKIPKAFWDNDTPFNVDGMK